MATIACLELALVALWVLLAMVARSAIFDERAKAVRFTTLDAVCRVLDCQPGDVLRWVPDEEPRRED